MLSQGEELREVWAASEAVSRVLESDKRVAQEGDSLVDKGNEMEFSVEIRRQRYDCDATSNLTW